MEPDVVQAPVSHRLQAWLEDNRTQALWGASIVAIVGLVLWFVMYQRGQKEIAAGEALSNAALVLPGSPGPRPDLAQEYLKIASSYPNSAAATRALLLAAGSLFAEGKLDDAKMQFQKFTREHRDSPLMGEALMGIAACLDAQGNINEATVAYKELVDRHPTASFTPQAKLALARLYQAQNKPELALTYLEEAAQSDPYGSVGAEAGIRAEELKIKYPALAPKPAALTPTVTPGALLPANARPGTPALTNLPAAIVSRSQNATNASAPKPGAQK